MNARHALLLAALTVSLPLAIAGCGNKGPLVMADEVEPVEESVMPTGLVPVQIKPQDTLPATEPAEDEPGFDAIPIDPIPIDPDTVPDSTPATGTADDGDD